MNALIQQLVVFIQSLQPAPGASVNALRDLLRIRAAEAIQQDPAQGDIPPGDIDPLIEDAIRAGTEQARALTQAGTRLRLGLEDLPLGTEALKAGEQRSETFGPFIELSGRLLRFVAFHSSAFIPVNAMFLRANLPGELLLLVPAASTPDAVDLRQWTIAPGTVWIGARFLVAGATGMVGLRIAGGTLSFALRPSRRGTRILVPVRGNWTLSVEPETPPGDAGASDAGALVLTLPARLEVHSNAAPVVTGGAVVSGFGSTLNLTVNGNPITDGHQISFPMAAAEPQWSIAGNLSSVAQFVGASAVTSPRWSLPISATATNLKGEAAHGGSVVIQVPTGITSTFAKQQGGPSLWFAATLTVNAECIELDAVQAASTARYDDLDLWSPSASSLQFLQSPVTRLLFRSERGGFDTAVVIGGGVQNKWDLPRRADGHPFPFDGQIDAFGLLATPTGSWLTCSATAKVADQTFGLALENIYFTVRAPRKLFVLSAFDEAPSMPSGIALLFFDVNFALPTLPDPYAANWPIPDAQDINEIALRLVLEWEGGARPTLAVHLDKAVRFPEPRFPAPSDQDDLDLYRAFQHHIESQPEFLYLLDMSSRVHLLGVAFESPSDLKPELLDNRLAFPMRHIRLLMQPQVQWEPVQIEENFQVKTLHEEIVHSIMNGGPTLMGANSVTLIPALPEQVSNAIIEAIGGNQHAAALFSLPFGLRAMARLSPPEPDAVHVTAPGAITEVHEPAFGDLSSARQMRITARNTAPAPSVDPSRSIPGMMRQLKNLRRPNLSNLSSVTPDELLPDLTNQFSNIVPLHHADLSGYGLSSFSEWVLAVDGPGFCKVQFQVLNGRTAYEVMQFRSVLYECGARTVRTVILERHNSGRVFRYDSGWVAVEPGLFMQPKPFEKGAVKAFKNIRRIRIAAPVIQVDPTCAVQPVIFDADVELDGRDSPVPIYDRPGYIQVQPPPPAPPPPNSPPPPLLTDVQLEALFARVGPIGGPIDAVIRVGGTLEMQLSSIVSDTALDDDRRPGDNLRIGFAVAVVGTPKLPLAGQWSVMRVDPVTREVSPVDQRRGVPIVRAGAQPFRFREPSDTRRSRPKIEHALLMATESSRVLFAQPLIDPAQVGKIQFDVPPVLADPYSLVQSTGHFPSTSFALKLKEKPLFHVGLDNHWRIDQPDFQIDVPPVTELMKGGEWGINRAYTLGAPIRIDIDSTLAAPFKINVPASDLKLDLPQFPPAFQNILKITGTYKTLAGGIPTLENPDIVFTGALEEVKKTLHSLSQLLNLPFEFDVSVTSGSGSSPSFVVHMKLLFRLGRGPGERVDIGLGKFYGEFTVLGELEAALTGAKRALLAINFEGDVQQGIIPPLIYAGGLFRFGVEINETGRPIITMALGVVASIGGELIPGLLRVEVTVHYGYTLIPDTLALGVLLGLDARAKLLGGLIGFSFGVEAMAAIQRKSPALVTVWAQIRVAASVQIAIFIEESIDFETQFQQDIPLAAVALIPGVGLLPAALLL